MVSVKQTTESSDASADELDVLTFAGPLYDHAQRAACLGQFNHIVFLVFNIEDVPIN